MILKSFPEDCRQPLFSMNQHIKAKEKENCILENKNKDILELAQNLVIEVENES